MCDGFSMQSNASLATWLHGLTNWIYHMPDADHAGCRGKTVFVWTTLYLYMYYDVVSPFTDARSHTLHSSHSASIRIAVHSLGTIILDIFHAADLLSSKRCSCAAAASCALHSVNTVSDRLSPHPPRLGCSCSRPRNHRPSLVIQLPPISKFSLMCRVLFDTAQRAEFSVPPRIPRLNPRC